MKEKNGPGKKRTCVNKENTEETMETLVELFRHIELLVAEVAPDDPLWGYAIWSNNRAIKILRSLAN